VKDLSRSQPLLVTLGDPEGIGPEVIAEALAGLRLRSRVVIIGDRRFYPDKHIKIIKSLNSAPDTPAAMLEIDPRGNDPSFMYVAEAVSLAMTGLAGGIVTGPVSKKKWIGKGHLFMGHTDYLARTTGTDRWAMFFWSDPVKIALFTTHIPLKDIFGEIKKEKLVSFCRFIYSELLRITGKRYHVLMSGLNPHAGENGTLGSEEEEEIIPAVAELNKEMSIDGPFPPDTIFLEAAKRKDSVIIALYHDQGLIPFKLQNINCGVNLTLGLPFVRTSPDHGTAFDIAGKGIANAGSMSEALILADMLINRQLQTGE
jgi:4-hydroxythreonine-4-phosphate dehydrogenase